MRRSEKARLGNGVGGWLAGMAMALGLAGCGGGPAYNSITVHGTVSVDRERLAEGAVQFVPLDSGMGPAVGAVIEQGRFTAPGVPLGSHCVLFTAVRKGKELPPMYNLPQWETVNLIPQDKRAGIVVRITKDSGTMVFEL